MVPSTRLRVALGQHAVEDGERVRAGVRVREPVEGGGDVLGVHRRPVVELHALADLEAPDAAALARRPALGQPRLRLEVAVRPDQVLAGLAEHAQPALVGDRDRVERAGRLEDPRADRAAALRRAGLRRVLLLDLLPAHAAGGGDQPEQRDRHADDGAAADELAAADVAGPELVDQVVLERGALRADLVQATLPLAHQIPPCPAPTTCKGSPRSVAARDRSKRPAARATTVVETPTLDARARTGYTVRR